jgi:hypothetical protein
VYHGYYVKFKTYGIVGAALEILAVNTIPASEANQHSR